MQELRMKAMTPAWDLRGLRRRADMTQAEAAARLGVSAQVMNQWENGAAWPTIDKLPRIAAVLGATMDELVPALIRTKGGRRDGTI